MTLRRKLLVVFSGLAAIALIIAGLTLWITTRWDTTSRQLEAHYQRSLLLQQVRAATFQAVKEVSDAMFLADHDAPKEFRVAIAPAEEGLKQWAELADTEEERAEVEQVRAAFRQLVADTDRAFALIQQGDRTAAGALIEEQLERTDYPLFQRVTQSAVDRDRARRLVVRAATQNVQDTAHIILAIAGFGMLSLVLLLAAYLASDLFQPLKTIEQALVDLGRGDLKTQLSENREDEIGRINRAFNRMAEGVRQRERVAALTSLTTPAGAVDGDGDEGTFHDWRNTLSRVALHNLVTQLRGRLTSLQNEGIRADTADLSEALQETNDLLTAVTRLAEFSFPLDLNLARTDLRALIYDALLRFQDEISERSVSLEINLDPSVHQIIVDRLKLREVISEAIRNALAALPNQGGRLGVRTLVGDRKDYVALEIADNGRGMDAEAVSRLLDYNPFKVDGRPRIGLALTKSVTEQHGGQFDVTSRPGLGTVVRVELPVRL